MFSSIGKALLWGILLGGLLAGAFYGGIRYEGRSKAQEVAAELSQLKDTVKLKDELYAIAAFKFQNLQELLDTSQKQNEELKDQVTKAEQELLTVQTVSLQWKKAYEGELKAKQTTVTVSVPALPVKLERKRVDFTGQLGPVVASGYTLTDPAFAELSLKQVRPLELTVAVSQDKQGRWSSYVTSSDPNVDVKMKLSAVNPSIVIPSTSWKQRIWGDVSLDPMGMKGGALGLSYHLDDLSVGAECGIWQGGYSCGIRGGIRLFR